LKIQNLFILLIGLSVSSCGLFHQDKPASTPATESIVETNSPEMKSEFATSSDDLFKESINKDAPVEPAAPITQVDAPNNINVTPETPIVVEEPKVAEQIPAVEVIKVPEQQKIVVEPEQLPVITEAKIEVEPDVASTTPQIYKVQKSETLMQIAFKIYGDISKWKDLKKMNNGKLSSNTALKANTELKYIPPTDKFVWKHEGKPYLIKMGDTLGTISDNVYQTPKLWKKIWENNKPLIKNPNIIYAGFTVYYKDSNEVAKKQNNDVEINNIDEEINNIQSSTERDTKDISPLAE
jgi:nucleoid-associated protein YgaU